LAVGDWKNQKKQKKRSKHSEHSVLYFAYMGRRNPSTDCVKIFCGDRYPERNHVCQIWWRSVKGFRVGAGSKFTIYFAGRPYNTLTLPISVINNRSVHADLYDKSPKCHEHQFIGADFVLCLPRRSCLCVSFFVGLSVSRDYLVPCRWTGYTVASSYC